MMYRSLMLTLLIAGLVPGCYKSEISDKPAAEVSEGTATTATETTDTAPVSGAAVANVIKEKSSINFVGAKVTRDHKGQFPNFDGRIEHVNGQPSKIAFDIDLTTIETDTPKLTEHLKTADFFDVAKFPKATFESTSIAPAPAGSPAGVTHEVKGTLNMHGVAKEVTIPVKTETTPEGLRATSEFTINRHDWGISYRGAADDLVRDDVLIRMDLLFPPPPQAA